MREIIVTINRPALRSSLEMDLIAKFLLRTGWSRPRFALLVALEISKPARATTRRKGRRAGAEGQMQNTGDFDGKVRRAFTAQLTSF